MRYYILDDVVDPLSAEFLQVENAQVVQRPGPTVEKCQSWCGYRSCSASQANEKDCCECQDLWIISAELVAPKGRYPVLDGIPRLLPKIFSDAPGETLSQKTQESFGHEWEYFDKILPEYADLAQVYFRVVPTQVLAGATVLDAGCGMGRWSCYVAEKSVRRLYALDYSRAIDRAAKTLEAYGHVHCLQGDIRFLPFRPRVFDFVYCLGVLHHLVNPDQGMSSLINRLKENGRLLIYLYYAFDNRHAYFRWMAGGISVIRWFTSHFPKSLMYALAWVIALGIYWPLARFAATLEHMGLEKQVHYIPLHDYRHWGIRIMVNDAFDRFATPVEKRYTRRQIADWLAQYGFRATFSEASPYWIAFGKKSELEK